VDALASADVLLFEGFRLDRCRGRLLKHDEDGVWRPVALGSRALDVLTILADRSRRRRAALSGGETSSAVEGFTDVAHLIDTTARPRAPQTRHRTRPFRSSTLSEERA
jgi:hypothetical protein